MLCDGRRGLHAIRLPTRQLMAGAQHEAHVLAKAIFSLLARLWNIVGYRELLSLSSNCESLAPKRSSPAKSFEPIASGLALPQSGGRQAVKGTSLKLGLLVSVGTFFTAQSSRVPDDLRFSSFLVAVAGSTAVHRHSKIIRSKAMLQSNTQSARCDRALPDAAELADEQLWSCSTQLSLASWPLLLRLWSSANLVKATTQA